MIRRRLLSVLCLLALTVGLVPAATAETAVTMLAQGWQETLCAQLTGVKDAEVAAVAYIDQTGAETALSGEDFTYLVRDVDGGVRIDIPGVKAGTYDLAVTLKNGNRYVAEGLEVRAYDRSGFAHKVHTRDAEGNITGIVAYTDGVGAYNDDGTLKDNATVIYVTEANKNTVTLTQGFTVTGIGNILNCKGWDKRQSDSSKRKLLLKMADANRPLVIRILGEVTKPEGTTTPWSTENGGAKDDAGGMCMMEYVGNITIEGVGTDATVNGWGFSFSADGTGRTAEKNNKRTNCGQNIEVRNITFKNVPEDCVNIMGAQDTKDGFKDSAEHSWVHNCSFYGPKGLPDQSKDKDKSEGDGAVDFRNGEYMTLSYNYFEGYHKTSLVGSADDNLQYHVTWHHNWWKNVYSRSPLCRQADVHIYNNLYDGQTSYCMSLRANSYVFSEYNTFVNNCNNPVKLEKSSNSTVPVGACKSFADDFSGVKSGTVNQATVVNDKAAAVSSTNLYANFDTDATLSYIPTGDYALQTDAAQAAETVQAQAGVMKPQLTVSGHCTTKTGTLGEDIDLELKWIYTDQGQVVLEGDIPEGAAVFVAGYDATGRCVGIGLVKDGVAKLRAGLIQGKVFLLDGEDFAPWCAAAGWGDEK